jgi:hypothetical protein
LQAREEMKSSAAESARASDLHHAPLEANAN